MEDRGRPRMSDFTCFRNANACVCLVLFCFSSEKYLYWNIARITSSAAVGHTDNRFLF